MEYVEVVLGDRNPFVGQVVATTTFSQHVSMYACMYVDVCVYINMYVCMYVEVVLGDRNPFVGQVVATTTFSQHVSMYVCMFMYAYIHIYVCVYECVYMYVC
jgi:hypothetical protein